MKSLFQNKKSVVWILMFFSFIGFLSATYLTIEYYLGESPSCSFLGGCDIVAKSKFAQIGPIPLALLGAGYFFGLFVLFLAFLDTKKTLFFKLAFGLSIAGILVAPVLLWLQFAVIGSVCLYCLISDFSAIFIFIILFINFKLQNN